MQNNSFEIINKNGVCYGTFKIFNDLGFINAFSCRNNGDSIIVPNELNLALHVSDENTLVKANRMKLANALGINPLTFTTCEQVHGNKIAIVTKDLIGKGATDFVDVIKDVDGLVTKIKGTPLLFFFADCVPIILADKNTRAIALVHAGWRGSVSGIVQNAVKTMQKEFNTQPKDILAGIGPSIGQCCYEVDEVVINNIQNNYELCYKQNLNGKYQLDLWQLNKMQLQEIGVFSENIFCANICTSCHNDLFFSYRSEHGKTGRLGAVIYNEDKKD